MSELFYIIDDSGLLSLTDVACYKSFLSEDWTYEGIVEHFEKEMEKRSVLVWDCGDGGDSYSVEVRRRITEEHGIRAFEGSITASDGKLHIISYSSLTMAAQFEDERLPSFHEATNCIEVERGTYRVRIIQLFDPARTEETPAPDFIIELEAGDAPICRSIPWLRT